MAERVKVSQPHSPNYYVKRRLLRNIPALAGLLVIILAAMVAILGYWLMPDNTPNANNGVVQLKKKLPGFSVQVIKDRRNMNVERRGMLGSLLYGQENPFNYMPVDSYTLTGDKVEVRQYGGLGSKTYDLVPLVRPLFVGSTGILGNNDKFRITGEKVEYVHLDGSLKETTLTALQREFEENHVATKRYWLGTDRLGRDLLSRLLYGTRISLSIGFVAVLISLLLGVGLGAVAGYFGGRIDAFVMWFMSVVWSIPGIMLVIAISLALQSPGVWVAFVAVGLTMWVEVARVVRGQMLSIREKQFIEAAKAFGLGNFRIIMYHVMPNILGPLVVIATANFASAILLEAGLSFLGLSVQPPTPSWGIMINDGFSVLGSDDSWHLIVFPGVAISIMVLAFNLLGNGLRDAFDPKTIKK